MGHGTSCGCAMCRGGDVGFAGGGWIDADPSTTFAGQAVPLPDGPNIDEIIRGMPPAPEMGSRQRAQRQIAAQGPMMVQAAGGLSDLLTGAVRSVAKTSLGWPGSLEAMLVDATGADGPQGLSGLVAKQPTKTFFPTIEDIDKVLPNATNFQIPTGQNVGEDLGQWLAFSPGQVARGARAVGRAALEAADQILQPGARWGAQRGAVRMPGGNFRDPDVNALLRGGDELSGVYNGEGAGIADGHAEPVQRWAHKQLANYLRKDVGSPKDPLLQVEREYPDMHMPVGSMVNPAYLDALNAGEHPNGRPLLPDEQKTMMVHNMTAGLEPLTPWGLHSGNALEQTTAGRYRGDLMSATQASSPQELDSYLAELPGTESTRWLASKAPKSTPVYGLKSQGSTDDLGFGHVLDYLGQAIDAHDDMRATGEAAMRKYAQDPAYTQIRRNLQLHDAGLTVDPEALQRLSVADAVRKTIKWNEMLEAQTGEANPGLAKGIAEVHKEYPDGMRWVRLGSDGEGGVPDFQTGVDAEGSAMGHSAGGYSQKGSYGLGGLDAITSDRARIYSLRDGKNAPHVTIEVGREPGYASAEERAKGFTPELQGQWLNGVQDGTIPGHLTQAQWYRQQAGLPEPPFNITQIKGKGNRAPVGKYLPHVQDFVRSGNWGRVRELENAGLYDTGGAFGPENRYVTSAEHARAIANKLQEPGMAAGGLVDENLLADDQIEKINQSVKKRRMRAYMEAMNG
jgi:hypothetical protein